MTLGETDEVGSGRQVLSSGAVVAQAIRAFALNDRHGRLPRVGDLSTVGLVPEVVAPHDGTNLSR